MKADWLICLPGLPVGDAALSRWFRIHRHSANRIGRTNSVIIYYSHLSLYSLDEQTNMIISNCLLGFNLCIKYKYNILITWICSKGTSKVNDSLK
ncbi:hypothetical protein EB796_019571 [Bugula neritina]|uniref:Uncharacterized protein n=1 Tax=Bugula neritina TaxID=10212 RepID=A0A7J7J7I3_BUGNE|nr:hypothetical protein EB796_019571 [Bugula neritina]